MNLFRKTLFACCLLLPTAGFAQQPDFSKNQPHYTREQIERMLRENKRLYDSKHIGMPLPEFSATTWDGHRMNNATMKGSIYLLTIFYPDCRCLHPEGFKKLAAIEAARKDFHVVALLQDTAYLYAYRLDHAEPLHYAVTDTREQFVDLRLDLSPPLYVLVDRKGIVVKVLDTNMIYELNKSEEEQDELAKTVQEMLLY